jgi:hypothetical protein
MLAYVLPEDKFDYCISCNYLEEVVAVIWLDSSDAEEPLCKECAETIPCEYLPETEAL